MLPSTSDRDPEFEIGTDGYLLRRAMLGERSVPICVEYEQTGDHLSPLQREAIRQALTLPPDVLRIAAPVVLQNYEVYRLAVEDDEIMPPLADPIQVWDEVTFSYIFVPPHVDLDLHVPTFMLLAECSWDPEHGLEVRFCNGIAEESNQQGEVGWCGNSGQQVVG